MSNQPSSEVNDNEHCSPNSSNASTAQPIQLPTNPAANVVKTGVKIRYRDYKGDPIREGTVISRGGRAKGVNKNWWNTTALDGSHHAVNLDQVYEWEIAPEVSDKCQTDTSDETSQETLIDNVQLLTNKEKELEARAHSYKEKNSTDRC
jgi:hypothetical protein